MAAVASLRESYRVLIEMRNRATHWKDAADERERLDVAIAQVGAELARAQLPGQMRRTVRRTPAQQAFPHVAGWDL